MWIGRSVSKPGRARPVPRTSRTLASPRSACPNAWVLGDPKRLKTASGHGYLVSWKHRLRGESDADARELAKRLLADPHNVEQLRHGLGRPLASLEELEEWLASGLAAKALVALKTKPRVPVFDPPEVTDLADLLPAETPEPKREVRSWIAVQAVDSKGRPLPFLGVEVTDHAATEVSTRGDEQARTRLDALPSDEPHTVTVRWNAEPATTATDEVPLSPGVQEPCWMKVELVDRKGRSVKHLQPSVQGVPAQPKRGSAFLAAGLDESGAWSVEVVAVDGEG